MRNPVLFYTKSASAVLRTFLAEAGAESAFPKKLLVETSIENLLLAGVPTALHTGLLAADLILERGGSG